MPLTRVPHPLTLPLPLKVPEVIKEISCRSVPLIEGYAVPLPMSVAVPFPDPPANMSAQNTFSLYYQFCRTEGSYSQS